MGKFWESYRHLGDYSEQHLHARHRLATLNWQLRRWARQPAAARKMSLESELHQALRDGRSHEVHRLTQLLGGKGIGVRKRRRDREEMKTHVAMPGGKESWRMDAPVVDIGETERGFQADLPPLEPLDINMATSAKEILFCTARNPAKRTAAERRHAGGARAELYLMFASLEGTSVGAITKSAKNYTRAKTVSWFLFWCTSTDHSTHHALRITQTAPWLTNVMDRKECWAPASFTYIAFGGKVSSQQW